MDDTSSSETSFTPEEMLCDENSNKDCREEFIDAKLIDTYINEIYKSTTDESIILTS